VEAQISLPETISSTKGRTHEPHQHSSKKINWQSGDITRYQEVLSEQLRVTDISNQATSDAIQSLQTAIVAAENAAIPSRYYKPLKGPKKHLSSKLLSAINTSKKAHFYWKEAGRPDDSHPLTERRKEASKAVRRIQRQEDADRRNRLYEDIMEAHEGDQATFYKLLRFKHGEHGDTAALCLEGELVYDQESQRECWATYFEKLATPKPERIQVQASQIKYAIKCLNSNKAADSEGLQAEHFKYAGPCIYPPPTTIIQ
jgi:hypothetical protein